jgi:uncharacterized protein YoxC
VRRRFFFIAAGVVLIFILAALLWVDIENYQRISTLETNVTGLETKVDDLNTTVNGLETRVNSLNTTVNGLETTASGLGARVNDLGNNVTALENMTWHPDGNYSLSPSTTTVTFKTEGKAWRMNYVFNGANISEMIIEYNLRVYDANGNIVGGLGGIELSSLKNSGKGTIFIPESQGTYSVEISGITGGYTFAFEVQSYY